MLPIKGWVQDLENHIVKRHKRLLTPIEELEIWGLPNIKDDLLWPPD